MKIELFTPEAANACSAAAKVGIAGWKVLIRPKKSRDPSIFVKSAYFMENANPTKSVISMSMFLRLCFILLVCREVF